MICSKGLPLLLARRRLLSRRQTRSPSPSYYEWVAETMVLCNQSTEEHTREEVELGLCQDAKPHVIFILRHIIIHFYQFGIGRHSQKAVKPVTYPSTPPSSGGKGTKGYGISWSHIESIRADRMVK